jgi:hypothetical protein
VKVNSSFAVNPEGGFENNECDTETKESHECHEQVGGGEEGPGCHVVVSNCKYYSAFLTKGKVRQTDLKGTVNRPGG